jgi:hypothetical protein
MCFSCYLHFFHNILAQSCLVLGMCGDDKGCRYDMVIWTVVVPKYFTFPRRLPARAPFPKGAITVGMLFGSRTIRAHNLGRSSGLVRRGKSSKKDNGTFNHPRPRCHDWEVGRLSGHGAKCPKMPENQRYHWHGQSARRWVVNLRTFWCPICRSTTHTLLVVPRYYQRP